MVFKETLKKSEFVEQPHPPCGHLPLDKGRNKKEKVPCQENDSWDLGVYQSLLKYMFFLVFLLTISGIECLAKPSAEGTWKYTVKVKNTTKFNRKEFLARERGIKLKNPPKVTNYVGNKKLGLNDTYYTGYFHLSKKPGKSKEIIGTYYPDQFVIQSEYIPIKFIKGQKDKKRGKAQLLWFTNFKNKSTIPEDVIWLTKASYKDGSNNMIGNTLAMKCAKGSNNCKVLNYVKWEAKRIADVEYYTKENHKWKPLVSKMLRFFDPTGNLEKFIFKRFFKKKRKPYFEYYRDANSSIFVKDNYKAALPAKAVSEPGPALQAICNPNYCGDTARFWPPRTPGNPNSPEITPTGSNDQERAYNDLLNRQAYCDQAVSGRRSLCCNPIASGGGELRDPNGEAACTCTEQTTGSPSSARCCRVFATCQEETTTRRASGAVNVERNNFSIDSSELSHEQQLVVAANVDPFMEQNLDRQLSTNFSGMDNISLDQIRLGTNDVLNLNGCRGGLPCVNATDFMPDI